MKTKIITLSIIALVFTLVSCNNNKTLTNNEIPREITTFVQNYFPNTMTKKVVREENNSLYTYKVTLEDDTKLKFDNVRQITEIDSKNRLPNSLVDNQILNYVNNNYSGHYIKKWELKDNGEQMVKLDNQKDLKFDVNGYKIQD